jgi:polyhydroxyalkanoate synthase subunit PhaE
MTNQHNTDLVENVVEAQKQAADAIAENTKKFTFGNTAVNESIQKGTDWFKNWLDTQKNFFTQTSTQASTTAENVKDNTEKMNEFYKDWYNMQINWAKQMWEMNTGWVKNTVNNATSSASPASAMNMWNDASKNWINWWSNMMQTTNWATPTHQWQNWASMDSWKKATENWTGLFNQYYEILNNNFAQWQKNIENGTVQEAYRNVVNVTDGFTRFYEMWAPLWKSIQEKTFDMEMYKQWMNPVMYKDLMDKYFGFLPDNARQYMQNMTDMMNSGTMQMSRHAINNYQQMRHSMMHNMAMKGNEVFGNMLSGYNNWYNSMNSAFAPLTRMMTPNQQTKLMMEWSDIANRIMVYNIKNAELQYLIYNRGAEVMDKVADNVMNKIKDGVEVNSIMALYQEWLNISDKTFVELFESDEYGKLMAEVSAMQMTLRKDLEKQMEKLMVGIPVATRTEMDELYKTIYDLKKQIRDMERNVEEVQESQANATAATNGTEHTTEEETEEKRVRKTKKA